MKVNAFMCNVCGELALKEDVTGIKNIEDLFSKLNSYPVVKNPSNSDIHYCHSCYSKHVIEQLDKLNRRKIGEDEYKKQRDILHFGLRQSAVNLFLAKKYF